MSYALPRAHLVYECDYFGGVKGTIREDFMGHYELRIGTKSVYLQGDDAANFAGQISDREEA